MANCDLFNSFFNVSTIESLKEEEKLIASLIFENAREVVTKISNSSRNEDFNDFAFSEQFDLMKTDLMDIINAFNEAEKAKRDFKKHFPKWVSSRKKNIKSLRELAGMINKDRFNCNVAKITGSSVGIVGGAVAVASLFPLAAPAAIILAVGGGIASLAGGATVFGTSVTEITLLKNKMAEAKVILEDDVTQFEPMAKWFEHSQKLIDLMNNIIGFDVIQEISKGIKTFRNDIIKSLSLKGGAIHSKLKDIIITVINKATDFSVNAIYCELVCLIPVVISFVFVMILFHKSNSLLFDLVVITHHTAFGLMKILDLGSDLGMLICNSVMKTGVAATEVVTKATARAVAQGALAGIGIALDVTNLVFSSIDIHKGSVSEKAVQLIDVSDKLEEELKLIEAVNDAMF